MKILAIDTSAVCASVAVTENGKILSESSINTGLTHSRTLMPMIDSVLRNGEIALDSIDTFACSVGPGSFTGIRIGVAAIKGLCDALVKKCVPVSTLEALAHNLVGRCCTAVSVMDARCNQVYTAITITNKGETISKEAQKQIFDRHFSDANGSENSMGIGQPLAKAILEKQNGYLTVESEHGETSFVMKYIK